MVWQSLELTAYPRQVHFLHMQKGSSVTTPLISFPHSNK